MRVLMRGTRSCEVLMRGARSCEGLDERDEVL